MYVASDFRKTILLPATLRCVAFSYSSQLNPFLPCTVDYAEDGGKMYHSTVYSEEILRWIAEETEVRHSKIIRSGHDNTSENPNTRGVSAHFEGGWAR